MEEDNNKGSKDGFFSNQRKIENNLTKNSYTFQRKKQSRSWNVKTETSKVENQAKDKVLETSINKGQIQKENVQNISKANEISMNKARNKAYWQDYVSKKKQQLHSSKTSTNKRFENKKFESVKKNSQSTPFVEKKIVFKPT